MGNVVPMDSKLLSNYWYMSWPSWPTHISKLCSHKNGLNHKNGLDDISLFFVSNYENLLQVNFCSSQNPGSAILA